MGDVACELAPTMDGNCLRGVAGVVKDFNLARLNHEKLEQTVTDVDEDFPIAILFGGDVGAVGELGNLAVVEDRKGDGLESMFGHGGLAYSCSPKTFA